MIKHLLWVAAGGAIGSVARFIVSKLLFSHHFPWGTFVVNISGCFLIGILWAMMMKTPSLPDHFRLFLITGICGGFTTFSAFSMESISLLREGKFSLFLAYAFGSLLFGFLATLLALKIFRVN